MRYSVYSAAFGLLSLFTAVASGAVLQTRADAVCASSEQSCVAEGASFCCPQALACGTLKNQCLPKPAAADLPAAAATTAVSQTSSIPTSTASSAPENSKSAIEEFFTTRNIIIVSCCGAAVIILVTLLTWCCVRKRRQGRLLLAAYSDPARDPYKPVLLSPTKKTPVVETTEIPRPHSRTQSPQPQYYDLYSPDSPAFQMTAQTPAGPLDHDNGPRYYNQPTQLQEPAEIYQRPQRILTPTTPSSPVAWPQQYQASPHSPAQYQPRSPRAEEAAVHVPGDMRDYADKGMPYAM